MLKGLPGLFVFGVAAAGRGSRCIRFTVLHLLDDLLDIGDKVFSISRRPFASKLRRTSREHHIWPPDQFIHDLQVRDLDGNFKLGWATVGVTVCSLWWIAVFRKPPAAEIQDQTESLGVELHCSLTVLDARHQPSSNRAIMHDIVVGGATDPPVGVEYLSHFEGGALGPLAIRNAASEVERVIRNRILQLQGLRVAYIDEQALVDILVLAFAAAEQT